MTATIAEPTVEQNGIREIKIGNYVIGGRPDGYRCQDMLFWVSSKHIGPEPTFNLSMGLDRELGEQLIQLISWGLSNGKKMNGKYPTRSNDGYRDILRFKIFPDLIEDVFDLCHGGGDSEIEKLFYATLRLKCAVMHPRPFLIDTRCPDDLVVDIAALLQEYRRDFPIAVTPQINIGGLRRADFLISALDYRSDHHNPSIRTLIIECDGHEFHERTKEQAANDKSRDRGCQMAGHQVFRFAGSEIWNSPLQCVHEVISWAAIGLPASDNKDAWSTFTGELRACRQVCNAGEWPDYAERSFADFEKIFTGTLQP